MRLHLDQVVVDLASDNNYINAEWARLFEGWLKASDSSTISTSIRLTLNACKQLPALPPDPPFFCDDLLPDGSGTLSVYRQPQNHVLLHFLDGALVNIPLNVSGNTQSDAHGEVTAQALQHGRFEDVTFTSLAPLLRRQGYFLVHAFAAARNGRCVLIVGATRSGKTTTGLNLLLNGWDLLSNDVVLLRKTDKGIYAYPTPGDVGIRPHTFDLLPQLGAFLPPQHPSDEAFNLSGERLVNGRWAKPCPITAIFLPKIITNNASKIEPLPRAISLAHLMQESIDRWDEPCLQAHINILQQLCKQANNYTLNLGQEMSQAPKLIGTYSK